MKPLVLAFCLLLGGIHAAQAAFFSDDEARKKITELQQQVSQLQGKLDQEAKQRQATDERVVALENQLKNQGMDLLNQIERLNAEISKLKGQMEVTAHDVEVTQKRQRDLYTDTDGRLRKLESGAATATEAAAGAPAQAAAQAATSATMASNTENEQKEYDAAYALTKAGKHAEAVAAFQQFTEHYPNGKLVPNAYYWTGTSQFSLRDYKSAIATQQSLVKQYPDHEKAPDALLNIANSQIQLADVDGARQTLKTLIAKYPQSRAAALGKKRLSAIESLKSKN
ncbi:MAG TPA: tol-pal system protein YbgF [Methylophilaceae bacterium]|nr:tol-pal system protein YbgF [Methylophilaceae bacterium]